MRAAIISGLLMLMQLGGMQAPERAKQHVAYVSEAQTVAAGKRAVVEVHFRVEDGFHVNSHTPKSEFLIPTVLGLGASDGVKVAALDYPPGKEFSFSFDPSDKLDVYSEDFVVKVPVVATAGQHELKGELKYQACDHAACFPPKALTVDLLFTAK